MSSMDSTTAPPQVAHSTTISAAAIERRERVEQMAAEHAALWHLAVRAVQHVQACEDEYADPVATFEALLEVVNGLPQELRDRLLKALPLG